MNQILDYNPNKSSKGSSGSDKIVRFFAIILIIFALCLVASGVYRMWSRNQSNNNSAVALQAEKATINVEVADSSAKITVTHTKAIESLIYCWNEDTETLIKASGENSLEKEIQLPTGTNVLHVKVVDVDGNETTYEKEITAVNGSDLKKPVITLTVTDKGKLKITATDETEISFITYTWNNNETVRIDATDDKKKIETEIEILKGKNNITVSAVDTSNNTTTEVKEYNGLTKPEVKLTLSSDKTKVNVSISHENGLKGVSGSLNGQDFNVDGVTEGTTSLNFDLNLVEGANKVKVVATSTDGTETIAEQDFTYGAETTENPTNTTENNTTDAGNDNQDKPKISAEQKAAAETLKAMNIVKNELGLRTVLGVSNISFGLPNREIINKTFLTIAMANGLDLPIINPNVPSMVWAVKAYKVLAAIDENSMDFIDYSSKVQPEVTTTKTEVVKSNDSTVSLGSELADKILKAMETGMKDDGRSYTSQLLKEKEAMEIINQILIPALDVVGDKFEKGTIFLPQLILAADVAKECFDEIKNYLADSGDSSESKGKIIVATVKGDIHDIGKNIVKVILENYGYNVIDLGRDVDCMEVVNAAIENDVHLVGLSALMTTTLGSMEETIKLLREHNVDCKIMVGGAGLTEDYAMKIGADYYAKDAKMSADIAKKVLG
mgnify:CR=1 FL=1